MKIKSIVRDKCAVLTVFGRRRRIRFLGRYFSGVFAKTYFFCFRSLLFANQNRFVPVWYITYILPQKNKSRGLKFF